MRAPVLVLGVALPLLAAPSSPVPHAPTRPSQPIPSLAVVARVRVEAAHDRALVTEEITFSRGEWQSGDLELYAAFGAPGVPRAFDVHLCSVPGGALAPDPADVGEPVLTERAPRRPATAQLLLGRATMAGEVLHVREAALRRAFAASGVAALRVRSFLDAPVADAHGGRELVVRLGIDGATPLALGRIEVASVDGSAFAGPAEAQLCGASADPYPLAVQLSPPWPVHAFPGPQDPRLAVRHASDDLCLRYFPTP